MRLVLACYLHHQSVFIRDRCKIMKVHLVGRIPNCEDTALHLLPHVYCACRVPISYCTYKTHITHRLYSTHEMPGTHMTKATYGTNETHPPI